LILILHTHGSESYLGEKEYVSQDALTARTADSERNVLAVGRALADRLNAAGIPTVQATLLHDTESYSGSYDRAAETIAAYRSQYPSIQLVIDLHRDAITTGDELPVRPVTWSEESGEAAAQLMFVVGSDWGEDEEYLWENNLALALTLRARLNERCPGLCRPVYLRPSSYNQNLVP
jgi:stage II sporulation protein P